MLVKENRLRKKREFEKVFKNSKSFKEDCLVLKIRKNSLGVIRCGFVVSKSVSKKAVLRNKVKRRLREAMKEKIKQNKKGIDIILISLPGIEKKSFAEISERVEKLWQRANADKL